MAISPSLDRGARFGAGGSRAVDPTASAGAASAAPRGAYAHRASGRTRGGRPAAHPPRSREPPGSRSVADHGCPTLPRPRGLWMPMLRGGRAANSVRPPGPRHSPRPAARRRAPPWEASSLWPQCAITVPAGPTRRARGTWRRTPSGSHASVQWGARRRADRPRQPAGVPAPGIIRAQHIPTAAQSVGRTAPAAARPHARDSAVRRLLHWCNTNHAASTVLMSNCGALCSDWTVRPIWAPLRPVRHHSGHPGPRQVSF